MWDIFDRPQIDVFLRKYARFSFYLTDCNMEEDSADEGAPLKNNA